MNAPTTSSAESVISLEHVSRTFETKKALSDVTLHVPRGSIFGLVGENGAGKTTLIKHVLGLLRAETGSVRVFGMDPSVNPVPVLGQLGYLSEYRELPGWMRIDELLRYMRAFYPSWDEGFAEELRRRFALDARARVRSLSQGQQAKAGLIVALAHRPRLLVLDEPSTGLDPVVRRDILEAIIRTVAQEGRTVLFSSHLLEEVERVSDQIAMMHQGRIVFSGRLDEIKTAHTRITVRFASIQTTAPAFPQALTVAGAGREWTILCHGNRERVLGAIARSGGIVVEEHGSSLDEIFVAHAAAGVE